MVKYITMPEFDTKSRPWPSMSLLQRLKIFSDNSYFLNLKQLVSGNIHAWFAGYLSDRKQRVVIPDAVSDWSYLRAGVPQGSIFGPLLFCCMSVILLMTSAQIFDCLQMIQVFLFL